MSRAYQCDICGDFYCNNKTTKSKVRNYINDFKLSGINLYSLYTSDIYIRDTKADICPNCTKRIQNTIDDIIYEHINQVTY